jgi:hypothetical protein
MQGVFDTILKEMFKGVEYEYKFHPTRKWRFDYAFPHAMVALEIEGGSWINGRHNRGTGFLRDMEKYNEAGLLGWRIFRVTPQQVKNGQAIVLLERIFEKRIDGKAQKWSKAK